MKKVTLGHLSRKHGMSIDELRTLFVEDGLMKPKARKVVKKPAKKLIHAYQAADDTAVASAGLFSWLNAESLSYLALGLLGLMALFGFMKNYADSMTVSDASIIPVQQEVELHGAGNGSTATVLQDLVQMNTDTAQNVDLDQPVSAGQAIEVDHAAALPETLPKTGAEL